MGKYLVLWEIDQTKIPVDPKERGDTWSLFMTVVRQDIEKGIVKDWGAFVGDTKKAGPLLTLLQPSLAFKKIELHH